MSTAIENTESSCVEPGNLKIYLHQNWKLSFLLGVTVSVPVHDIHMPLNEVELILYTDVSRLIGI